MTIAVGPVIGLLRLAEEAGDAKESINPVIPEMNEILWCGLFFFLLWALMKFVLLPPIISGRDERKAKVEAGIGSAADADAELAQITTAHNERINAAKAEAARIVDEARAEAEAQRSRAVADVEANIAQLKAQAQAEIDQARASALAGARGPVSELATNAAGKVLGRNVDLASSQSVIDGFLSQGASS